MCMIFGGLGVGLGLGVTHSGRGGNSGFCSISGIWDDLSVFLEIRSLVDFRSW